ncbi:MAG: bifunctional hydroxymethylpyrimidine kinase/phosphomethylpyrimidine kinase [Bacillota bacterium]|nr:bifunctional hydroxymethylpyrimidine kinase/phosphomethylpyrimidine kinase [Bacillota bacterium]MDW7683907.1 bifunctional hydroxymethylpyrimidine kinase/phosphomethylpyrimidine kinase [Bacillota bacterium]
MHKALTIAGSDSGGGAGIQTDLKTFAALGVYGTSVITALTAQNTKGVHGIHTVPPDFIVSQLDAVLSDIPVQAAKTGMLGETEAILAVTGALTRHRILNLVVDPVMVAQSGDRLLKEDAVTALRDRLLPLALVVTPNLPEAEVLLERNIKTADDMAAAAKDIHKLGPHTVLVKGGHLAGENMIDIFYDGKTIHRFAEQKLDTIHTHGTGCTYAAAIAAHLAKGLSPLDAVSRSKQFITAAISHGICIGSGYGPTNPMGALYRQAESGTVIDDLQNALAYLQKTPQAASLLAPGLSNLFACRENAAVSADVASFPAPLLRSGDKPEAVGSPLFDSAQQPGEQLLSAHRKNPTIQGMITLKNTPEIISAARKQGLNIHVTEDLLLLFAGTARDAANKTVTLSRTFRGC